MSAHTYLTKVLFLTENYNSKWLKERLTYLITPYVLSFSDLFENLRTRPVHPYQIIFGFCLRRIRAWKYNEMQFWHYLKQCHLWCCCPYVRIDLANLIQQQPITIEYYMQNAQWCSPSRIMTSIAKVVEISECSWSVCSAGLDLKSILYLWLFGANRLIQSYNMLFLFVNNDACICPKRRQRMCLGIHITPSTYALPWHFCALQYRICPRESMWNTSRPCWSEGEGETGEFRE